MGIFPPNSKKYKNINNRKRKGKDKESYIFIVYTIFYIKISGGLLVFFDDELTTFRNKNYRFICNVKKSKKSFMECEKDIGSMKNGHF